MLNEENEEPEKIKKTGKKIFPVLHLFRGSDEIVYPISRISRPDSSKSPFKLKLAILQFT